MADRFEQPLEFSIEVFFDRCKVDDHMVFYTKNGLRTVHLRLEQSETRVPNLAFMIKRCPEMRPYYSKIRAWFSENGIKWRDHHYCGALYMEAKLPFQRENTTNLVKSIQKDVFGAEVKGASPVDSAGLGFGLTDMKSPFLFFLFAFVTLPTCVFFAFYQLYKLGEFGAMSLKAFDSVETFLTLIFFICIIGVRVFSPRRDPSMIDRKKLWRVRIIMLAVFSLSFFTY